MLLLKPKAILGPAVVVSLAGLCGCAPPPVARTDVVRPVKTMIVSAGADTRVRTFPGRVLAATKAELAFQVPGLLTDLPVKAGQRINKGDLIAQLRQDEFQARVKTIQADLDKAQATLQALRAGERPEERLRREAAVRASAAKMANARSEYDRNAQLVRSNAVSREEFERSQTAYRIATEENQAAQQMLEKATVAREEDIMAKEAAVRGLEARLVEAKLQLDDSTLRAPFDGVIADRFVEPNQNVRANQPIVKFQDVDEVDVVADVPEGLMTTDLGSADIVRMIAEFSAAPGRDYPVRLKEVAQVADPVTQTFRVRVALKAPPDVNLLPGMTATLTVTYRRAAILGSNVHVPTTAVFQSEAGESSVWIVGPGDTMARRQVKVGTASGSKIEIVEGLNPGDRIAIAGVPQLREGMKVRDLGDALGSGAP